MKLTIKIRPNERFNQEIMAAVERGMIRGMQEIRQRAKELSPVKDGNNKDTIDFEITKTPTTVKGTIFSESGYGGWLEVGTGIYGPHRTPIVPVNGTFLAWPIYEGTSVDPVDWVYARSVRGRMPTPYLYPAFEEKKALLQQYIHEECQAVRTK